MKIEDKILNGSLSDFEKIFKEQISFIFNEHDKDKLNLYFVMFRDHYSQIGYAQNERFIIDNNSIIQVIDTKDRGLIPCSLMSLYSSFIHKELELYKYSDLVEITDEGYSVLTLETNQDSQTFFKEHRRTCLSQTKFENLNDQYHWLDIDYATSDAAKYRIWTCEFVSNMTGKSPDIFESDMSILFAPLYSNIRKVYNKDSLETLCFVQTSESEEYLHWDFTIYKNENSEKMKELNFGNYVIMKLWLEAKQLGKKLDLGLEHDFPWKYNWKPEKVWMPGLKWKDESQALKLLNL